MRRGKSVQNEAKTRPLSEWEVERREMAPQAGAGAGGGSAGVPGRGWGMSKAKGKTYSVSCATTDSVSFSQTQSVSITPMTGRVTAFCHCCGRVVECSVPRVFGGDLRSMLACPQCGSRDLELVSSRLSQVLRKQGGKP